MRKTNFIILVTSFLLFYHLPLANARGGGGGGGRGGGGHSFRGGRSGSITGSRFEDLIFGSGVFFGVGYLAFWRRRKMIQKAKKSLEMAAIKDSSWDLNVLKKVTNDTFFAYQEAWTKKNLESIRHLFTKEYFETSHKTLVETLNGKTNILEKISISDMNLMAIQDVDGQDGDAFVMEVSASMIDYTIRDSDGVVVESTCGIKGILEPRFLYERKAKSLQTLFTEYWIFIRNNGHWLLHDIRQTSDYANYVKNMNPTSFKEITAQEKGKKTDKSGFYDPKVY